MNELDACDNWIHDKLAADAQAVSIAVSRFYNSALPQGAAYPAVIYNVQGATDFQGLGTVRLLARPLYQIKAVCKGHPTAGVRLLADRIDELFGKAVVDDAESVNGSDYVISARRMTPIQYTERDTDTRQLYFHLGGLYRLEVSAV